MTARPSRPLLRRAGASTYLHKEWGIAIAIQTLAKFAVKGGGPRFYKAGRWPLYDPDDLDAWAKQKLGRPVASTAEIKRDRGEAAA